jgi:hypothetical protein
MGACFASVLLSERTKAVMDVDADVMARVGERGRGAFFGVAGIWRSCGQRSRIK